MKHFILRALGLPASFKKKSKDKESDSSQKDRPLSRAPGTSSTPVRVNRDKSCSDSTLSLTKEAPSIEINQESSITTSDLVTPDSASAMPRNGRPGKPRTMIRSRTTQPDRNQELAQRPTLERQMSLHRRSSNHGVAFSPALLNRIHSEELHRAPRWIERDEDMIDKRPSPTSTLEPWMLTWASGAKEERPASVRFEGGPKSSAPARQQLPKVAHPIYLPNSLELDGKFQGNLCCSCWLALLPTASLDIQAHVPLQRNHMVYLQVSPSALKLTYTDSRPTLTISFSSVKCVATVNVNNRLGRAIVLYMHKASPLHLLPVSLPDHFFTTIQKDTMVNDAKFDMYKYGLVPPFLDDAPATVIDLDEYAVSEQQDACLYLNFTLDSLLKQQS